MSEVMRLPKVYIAGPMTIPDPLTNFRIAAAVWKRLLVSGVVTPILPHTSAFLDMLHPQTWATWLQYDEQLLLDCDALLRLPGESKGADREVAFMKELARPVFDSEKALLRHFAPGAGPDWMSQILEDIRRESATWPAWRLEEAKKRFQTGGEK